MEVIINMLNVGDGDAIIVELIKPTDTLVMVIDGGKQGDYLSKVKPKLVSILKKYSKKAPDIVVCTHYDSDHIGGLIPLLEDYIDEISQVWVHATSQPIESLYNQVESLSKINRKIKNFKNFVLMKEASVKHRASENMVNEQKAFVIESLNQLKELTRIIPKEKIRQVFNGKESPLPKWSEIKILGPTKIYYDRLFPKNLTVESLILEEVVIIQELDSALMESLKQATNNPCEMLKSDKNAKITTVNSSSIIIAIDNLNDRYLFTGDAGIESFKNIPDWKTELKNLYFLKVPHHGSNNNMTKEMAEIMNPQYAYSSGDSYQDEEVIYCLAQKTKDKVVKTTKYDGDLLFKK